jgi:hypothetical protein
MEIPRGSFHFPFRIAYNREQQPRPFTPIIRGLTGFGDKTMKTESKWIECALEEATGLRNSEGEVMPGGFCCNLGHLRTDNGNYWTRYQIKFAKLTPVKEVQVDVLPGWVTDRREVYYADLTEKKKFAWATNPEFKEVLYLNGVPTFDTEKEAIAAADAQIARNLAERGGEIVRFEGFWDCMSFTFPEELHNKLAGKRVEITVREVKDQ